MNNQNTITEIIKALESKESLTKKDLIDLKLCFQLSQSEIIEVKKKLDEIQKKQRLIAGSLFLLMSKLAALGVMSFNDLIGAWL